MSTDIFDDTPRPVQDKATIIEARQWQIDNISRVKRLLANAIDHKKDYYQNHWLGKITRFILTIFNMWNNGVTASISKTEDFLLSWDSRFPCIKDFCDGIYQEKCFFFLTYVRWVHENLDTSNFYNYTPMRTIKCRFVKPNESLPEGFVRA